MLTPNGGCLSPFFGQTLRQQIRTARTSGDRRVKSAAAAGLHVSVVGCRVARSGYVLSTAHGSGLSIVSRRIEKRGPRRWPGKPASLAGGCHQRTLRSATFKTFQIGLHLPDLLALLLK